MIRQGFISYAHNDYDAFIKIAGALRQIERNYGFKFWSDKRLVAGDYWNAEIERNINASSAMALIVSNAFFELDYIFDKELVAIKQRRVDAGAKILPIVLEPCSYGAFIGDIQAVPTGTGVNERRVVPVIEWDPLRHGYDAVRSQIEVALCCWFGLNPIGHL